MSVNIRYTRAELLSLAPKPHEYTLAAGALQKFEVIEEEPFITETSSQELTRNEAAGRKGEGKSAVGSRRTGNSERFAPPSRNWRGSRDQEAFEEGYKYELERNAIKKKALQETMVNEQEKCDAAAANNEEGKEEIKQQVPLVVKEELKLNEDEEIERLMTSIALCEDGAKKVTKSRFFSGADSGSQGTAASFLKEGQSFSAFSTLPVGMSAKDQWPMHGMLPTSDNVVWNNLDAPRALGVAQTSGNNNVSAPSVVVGSLQTFLHSNTPVQATPQPPQPMTTVSQPTQTATATTTTTTTGATTTAATATGLSACQPTNVSPINQVRSWNAQDLEQMLLNGQKVNKQPTQEPPKSKPIDAAALETQLLLQVQQKMARSQAPTQQQQHQPHVSMPPPVAGTSTAISLSGTRTPPQVSSSQQIPQLQLPQPQPQLQQQQQPVPVSWAVTMPKVPSQQMQKKTMQPQPQLQPQPPHRHSGMPQPVPIIMSGVQGAHYYTQQPMQGHYVAGFMPGQGQQPMMLYRSPDGTTQYAMGATKFPTNTQLIFSQPQQQQHQQQQQQRR